jgi:hypothetical protein
LFRFSGSLQYLYYLKKGKVFRRQPIPVVRRSFGRTSSTIASLAPKWAKAQQILHAVTLQLCLTRLHRRPTRRDYAATPPSTRRPRGRRLELSRLHLRYACRPWPCPVHSPCPIRGRHPAPPPSQTPLPHRPGSHGASHVLPHPPFSAS